ncbi:MAG: ATP-binding cassette domain-containing protein [Pseudohongiellaceae bacterium]
MAINIRNLRYRYPGAGDFALKLDHLDVEAGSSVFLQGASGSGKSTLLGLLSGLLEPEAGTITVLGQELSALSGRERDQFRARHIGLVFQQFNLVPFLTVEANILLAAHFAGKQPGAVRSVPALLDRLQLPASLLARRADARSVGQQQRVAIARAVVNTPELLIADEPTSALDADARDGFMDLLFDLQRECRMTLLFVSHERNLARRFTRVIDMRELNGQLPAGGVHVADSGVA